MTIHRLKCESIYFNDVIGGVKRFELRKNDRNFETNDIIYLHETVSGRYTGRESPAMKVIYILHGGKFGLEKGYCIMQLKNN